MTGVENCPTVSDAFLLILAANCFMTMNQQLKRFEDRRNVKRET